MSVWLAFLRYDSERKSCGSALLPLPDTDIINGNLCHKGLAGA